jgi:methenyltetrahydrofolate cyclohydrolase
MAATTNLVERPNASQAFLREEPTLENSKSFWEFPVRDWLERVASPDPAPGRGSAAITVACIGTALFRKAFTVSLQKERRATGRHHALETALAHLDTKEDTLRKGADQNAAAFDSCIGALSLPHGGRAEKRIPEKAREELLVQAASMPLTLAIEIHGLFRFALDQLPSIHDLVLSDAIMGLRLLNEATACLLLTSESNLAKVLNLASQSTIIRQIRDTRHSIAQAEPQLACRLQNRQLTRSS